MDESQSIPHPSTVDDGDMNSMRVNKDAEREQEDRLLAEMLAKIDDWDPIIPDVVMDHYLQKAGFACTDHRVKRLLALAAQKFLTDIATDAFQHARIRMMGGPSGQRRAAAIAASINVAQPRDGTGTGDPSGMSNGLLSQTSVSARMAEKMKTVLTMDDLTSALAEYGVNIKRPDYYI